MFVMQSLQATADTFGGSRIRGYQSVAIVRHNLQHQTTCSFLGSFLCLCDCWCFFGIFFFSDGGAHGCLGLDWLAAWGINSFSTCFDGVNRELLLYFFRFHFWWICRFFGILHEPDFDGMSAFNMKSIHDCFVGGSF